MRGFTLIEILLTMSLVAIVGLLSAPFYGRFIVSQEVGVALDELEGSLRKAQAYAMVGKNDARWGVSVDADRITLFQGDSYVGRNAAFDEVYDIQGGVVITGVGEVIFSRVTGRPDTTPTVTVSGNGVTEIFVMNSEGVLEKQ